MASQFFSLNSSAFIFQSISINITKSYIKPSLFQIIAIIFIIFLFQSKKAMANRPNQYIYQFNHQQRIPPTLNHQLQHYRLEINKLNNQRERLINDYQRRIKELQDNLKKNRTPIFSKNEGKKPEETISYELYQRDMEIKKLKQQNTNLRQLISNSNDSLIKKQSSFDIINEKQNQINKLKKALIDLQGKFDGQYFTEHKIKKEYDILLQQHQKLKCTLRTMDGRRSYNQGNQIPSTEVLKFNKLKVELETYQIQNQKLKEALYANNQELSKCVKGSTGGASRGSQILSRLVNTETQQLQLQIKEFKAKNQQLNARIQILESQNERLQKGVPIINIPNNERSSVPNINTNKLMLQSEDLLQGTAKKKASYDEYGVDRYINVRKV